MSAPETRDPLAVMTSDGAVWTRRAVSLEGRGLYALLSAVDGCPSVVMATLTELAGHGVLIVPAAAGAELERLRLRTAELEAELEAKRAPGGKYPPALPWARLMDAEDLADFLDELAASAITHASNATALAEVEKTCATWRLIAEAQHGHNTAPGPDAVTRTFLPVASLREDVYESPLHHEYRVSHDLPETGSPSVPETKPRPSFFQPGHLYAARVGWPGGRERFRFRCDSITTDPETGKPRAVGQHGTLRSADGEWIWVENGRTFDDWRGGAWTDITDEAMSETGGASC